MVQGFFEGFDAQARRRHYVISVVAIIVAVAYCAFFSPSFMIGRQWIPSPSVTFNIAFFPVLVLAGLFGYVQSMIFCFLLLACFLVQDISTAYYAIQYVLVVGLVYQAAKALWLIDWRTVLLTSALTAILIGNGEYLLVCISFPQGVEYYSLVGQGALWLSALPECLIVFFGLYFFYRFAPDRLKEKFYCGFFYTWRYQRYVLTRQKHRGFRSFGAHVSFGLYIDLTLMIVLSIVLTYTLMANYFIQDISEDAFTIEDNGDYVVSDLHFLKLVEDENQVTRWKPSNPYEITSNNQTYGFIMRLFLTQLGMVLLSAMVPIIILSNYVAQKLAVDPIRQLSEFIDGYVNSPEEERSRYIKMSPQQEPFFKDEIYDAYVALRVLVQDVEDYVAKIQDAQDLENNLKVAQAANEAKSNFLSNISHEIRTPLNAVLGMDEMILRESHEPNTIEYAKFIQNAGKTLLSLINDVLDFSKIEAGMMEIIPVQYDLTSTINDLYNMISFRAREKNLKLVFDFDESMPHLLIGDEIRIKQCVLNMLNNAVKYSEQGSVSLNIKYERISTDDVFIDVFVRDTGIGIKKEDMDKLFAPFQRIDERNNLTIEGTGLGMSIVRNLLHAMGSELHVESEYGRGSVFYFRILQRVVSWEPIGDFTKMFREMSDGKEEKFSESFHAPQARLLVVDDTQMNLSVVKGLLKPTRVQVDTAGSGKEALAMLERESYDLMLIDYRMPQMDGVELLHHIRELDGNLNQFVPCIVLTANAISGARDEYLAAGFNDYLAKPINGQLLDQMVARYLPQDKIIYAGMDGFLEEVDVADTTSQEVEAELRAVLGNAKMFNVDKALEYCEEPEILRDALEEFYLAISSKADDIERFAKEKDYRNFTILVHALKSSARLIGVDQLSSYAGVLEECGNNEREDKIHELTPELLRQYRELEPILAPLFTSKDEDLPDISDEELAEAWGDLRELLEVYDYTNADRIMQMLKGYRIPADAKAKYERVRELMAAVDRDQLLELL